MTNTMVDLPNTMVDLPNTMVDLPNTMVDLPNTMVDLPNARPDQTGRGFSDSQCSGGNKIYFKNVWSLAMYASSAPLSEWLLKHW
jgi:hypothetical protein